MISSSSDKHLSTSEDWINQYAETLHDIDPNIDFETNTSIASTSLNLKSMIPPSLPNKTGEKECMPDYYKTNQGQKLSFQNPGIGKSEEIPKAYNTTSSLTRENGMDQTLINSNDYCSYDIFLLLNANNTAVLHDRESQHHDGRIMQDTTLCDYSESADWIPSCASCESISPNFSQPTPPLEDFAEELSICSSTMLSNERSSERSNWLHQQRLDLPSDDSVEDAKAMFIQKKKLGNDERRCPNLYVSEILPTDVLLGRGGRSNHHPGNIAYRNQVGVVAPYYFQAKHKRTKTSLSQSLVNLVQKEKLGRFLQLEKDTTTTSTTNDRRWYVVSNVVACRKAAQAIRECVNRNRGASNSNA